MKDEGIDTRMNTAFLQLLCSKCDAWIDTILKPCPNCGHQHPLTEFGKKYAEELKQKELDEVVKSGLI